MKWYKKIALFGGTLLFLGACFATVAQAKGQKDGTRSLMEEMSIWKALQGQTTISDLKKGLETRRIATFPEAPHPLIPKIVKEEETLLFSDSPEYVDSEDGILYEDYVTGKGRVYFYHVNASKPVRKIGLVVANPTDEAITIGVTKQIVSDPTDDYFAVGRQVSRQELEKEELPMAVYVGPKEKKLLFPDLEVVPVRRDQLISGIVEFNSPKKVKISVMMLAYGKDPVQSYDEMPLLATDSHQLRGTFKGANRVLEVETPYNTLMGPAYLEVANNREDPYIEGYDLSARYGIDKLLSTQEGHLTGSTVATGSKGTSVPTEDPIYTSLFKAVNHGNYGVREDFYIPTEGDGAFELYFNPLGGAFAGSVLIEYGNTSEIFDLPTAAFPYMGHKTIYDSRYINTYKSGKTLHIRFMSPGASNLPVRFLFIPVEKEKA